MPSRWHSLVVGDDTRTLRWAFGLWTSLPSGTGQCGSIIAVGSARRNGSPIPCSTNDLNADTIIDIANCTEKGARKLYYRDYTLESFSLADFKFDRTEDVVAWNRAGSPQPACVYINDAQLGLAASTTLSGKANAFTIKGGEHVQLVARHTRELTDCHTCTQAAYHWCSIHTPLPQDHNSFDPDIPETATSVMLKHLIKIHIHIHIHRNTYRHHHKYLHTHTSSQSLMSSFTLILTGIQFSPN